METKRVMLDIHPEHCCLIYWYLFYACFNEVYSFVKSNLLGDLVLAATSMLSQNLGVIMHVSIMLTYIFFVSSEGGKE